MSSFLTEVKGFTPIIDALAQETSLITAAVYGVVWRYCQMEDRICRASLQTIGERVGISRKTVERHIATLVELGYLIDLTPDRKNAPHIYRDSGRVKIIGLVEARSDRESEQVRQSDLPRSDRESVEESIKESTKEMAPAAGEPKDFTSWLAVVKSSKNPQATIVRMVKVLFPGEKVDYGRAAKTARLVGGYGRLAQLIWQANSYQPTGDILSYCIGLSRNGRKNSAPGQSISHPGDEIIERDGRKVIKVGQ